ncbi:hypothetical protein EVB81_205 [Rhizobium phage RHph_I46]|uniref:Uncharacterized protein n=1 Tax=Rhizobium phage RHph_I1_9 TaxID=2509729 RepID=A0A7S5R9M2_9CAUD|nr:hypothetical protein PP936_gp203 [Rhizobium phage RHph_I1_9]QIG69774.1 hypothetical protein EVB81_205 [Rhizobium phage RHph_I46]QIG71055.1 hypothetical protein EVB92_205 [Rhizobium phage RHph_I9]QIG73640.1 hypothetical protein EVC04_203 [Rhizobium phage RHph_I1_9]QIG76394.1 hypothetical protein EVC25_205 [Rhizobium phage RHph_I34]
MIKVHIEVKIKRWMKGEESFFIHESTEETTILSARSVKNKAKRQFAKALKQYKDDETAVIFARFDVTNLNPPYGSFFGSISGRKGIVIMKTGLFDS